MAPLEFVVPDRVKHLSLERLPTAPYPRETPLAAKDIREHHRAHLRDLVHQVRNALEVSQRRYKRAYGKLVQPVNQALEVGDWVFVDSHARDRQKLDETVVGPYRILTLDAHTFTVLVDGYPERVSGDHVARAPPPRGGVDPEAANHSPKGAVIQADHEDTGVEFVWERFVGHEQDEAGHRWLRVRWWEYAAEADTWESAAMFDGRKVDQYCRREGIRPLRREVAALADGGLRLMALERGADPDWAAVARL